VDLGEHVRAQLTSGSHGDCDARPLGWGESTPHAFALVGGQGVGHALDGQGGVVRVVAERRPPRVRVDLARRRPVYVQHLGQLRPCTPHRDGYAVDVSDPRITLPEPCWDFATLVNSGVWDGANHSWHLTSAGVVRVGGAASGGYRAARTG
jgi:hypothetical protein